MNTQLFCKHLATLGPIGYLKMPGTIATGITIPFVYAFYQLPLSLVQNIYICALITVLSYYIIKHALPFFPQHHDPSEIVLDEVAGCMITFCTIPLTLPSLILGFILFRFFDIAKPLFIKKCEQLPGATGIVADDIGAALASHLLLRIILFNIS